ncbi:MAG: DUF5681 domain-containing protein [Alphaproteobacteria bacterium]
MSDDKDDEVGYGKPPKRNRFKKGQSGNPKGRPKGTRNFSTDLKDTLNMPVRINADGKPETVSTQRATLLRLREIALKGDIRSIEGLVELAQRYNDEQVDTGKAGSLGRDDTEILAALKQSIAESMSKDDSADPAPETTNDNDAEESDNG